VKSPSGADRRVQRTHRMLSEALIELILERGWDSVSIQEICDRANVGRSTFYTHFADKEDLLVGGLANLGRFLRSQESAQTHSRPLAFARGLIEHVDEQRRLVRAMVGKRSGQIMQQRFRQLLVNLVREDLEALAPASPRLEVTVRYVAGAFFEVLTWWIEARSPLTPAELERHFHELTTPVLAALRNAKSRGA
jgi:AcrR family transcriptional regulator